MVADVPSSIVQAAPVASAVPARVLAALLVYSTCAACHPWLRDDGESERRRDVHQALYLLVLLQETHNTQAGAALSAAAGSSAGRRRYTQSPSQVL
jgi:hypothetical protein